MKKLKLLALALGLSALLAGCRESERVSYNLSKEADNFNVVRKITIINAIKGEVLYQVTGKMSIEQGENQLVIIAEDDKGEYKKHFIGLSDNVTYVVEDITGKGVSNTKYTLIFNPEMVIPIDAKLAD
ncbi:hypothetical protein Javan174_0029 [Streptococcus phage Javan174]|uniref:beta-sandwich lipoprotein n=1 Tax=Streptococcus entericus TaxID=155680 RepID=UPI00036D0582|nr:hypothetical protein [Streptococcus entericus]QBX24095.1 hypothetical protein Javan174_0029 [Streptococcus phage Javan174]